ncbi:MAG: GxxExxY protein, partial [Muribaculaceae bacterium]|nr:GxxExxY protein [Muribaculaceae bacterium]
IMKLHVDDRTSLNEIGSDIIGASFEVRKVAGRYFREKYYKYALAYELRNMGHTVEIEKTLPALYKGFEIEDSYYMDLVIDDKVVVETKALRQVGDSEYRQLMSYLMLSHYKLGYLINFGVEDFTIAKRENKFCPYYGIYRFVNQI